MEKLRGVADGLTSLARPYASRGDCEAGVPVNIHSHMLGLSIRFSVRQRVVVAVLYALASSITIMSKFALMMSSSTMGMPS